LPLRSAVPTSLELQGYLRWLSNRVELIVVDGSDTDVFVAHARRWSQLAITHTEVDRNLRSFVNGKVAGVLTGLRLASYDRVIVADDDVRYDGEALECVAEALDTADVVRPQNYFAPFPWHAFIDTGRTLLNRVSGGDWPGTMGVRRARLIATGGYDGNVLFENLELVRTVVAAGGRAHCPLGLYVRRLPPSTAHFVSQRIRQAYDEFARPRRLCLWLTMLPAVTVAIVAGSYRSIAVAALATVALAEIGRRVAHGARVFPAWASLAAPLWVCERAICVWLAVAARVFWGGIPYRGRMIARAATPMRMLQQRLEEV